MLMTHRGALAVDYKSKFVGVGGKSTFNSRSDPDYSLGSEFASEFASKIRAPIANSGSNSEAREGFVTSESQAL